ncbi:MAG: tRNA(fMet)-specific endonuclease VapC [Chloroflexi bacterium OLB14]|nr:MAG: tRNA(fMet)-specific endonuclease VapC [Chloroflexi bacterium OLB14]
MIAVFDTNIVIDALNGVLQADSEFEGYERVIISRITWMEILVGEKENDQQLRDFLENNFEIASIDLAVSEIAVQLRRQFRIRLPDAIIWATAKVHNAILVTRNTKDFDKNWEGIRIPYEI